MHAVRELLIDEEGLRLTVYKDTGGVWTVGYGHVVLPGDGLYPYTAKRDITQAEADTFFANDISKALKAISVWVNVPLSDSQRAALISLTFNIGVSAFRTSTLRRKLNLGDTAGAANEFSRWVYDNGVRNEVLVSRRQRERALFLS